MSEAIDDIVALTAKHRALCAALTREGVHTAEIAEIRELEQEIDYETLPEELEGAIKRTISGVGRVSDIVRAMREFAHPGSLEMLDVDINHALRTTLAVACNEYKYVATVELTLGEIPAIRGHTGDLQQTFLNILVNASHAIAERYPTGVPLGVISIRTCLRDEHTVLIAIADTGTGIPEDVRQRVFDPFFTTKEVGRGTGHGLAMSRSVVVDKHGGELTVESTVGEGTTFLIALPIQRSAALATPSESAA